MQIYGTLRALPSFETSRNKDRKPLIHRIMPTQHRYAVMTLSAHKLCALTVMLYIYIYIYHLLE